MTHFKKTACLTAFALLIPFLAQAQMQIPDPVSFTVKEAPDKVEAGDTFTATIKASIEEKWHIYAVHLDPDAGPFPTKISAKGNALKIDGKIKESKPETAFDPNFKAKVSWHSNQAIFTIPLKLTAEPSTKLAVDITYQACNDNVCMPPKTKTIVLPTMVKGVELLDVASSGNETNGKAAGGTSNTTLAKQDNASTTGKAGPSSTISKSSAAGEGIFSFLWIAILAGFAALLTPCVFPMIPLTVSYFTKQKGKKRGVGQAIGFGAAIVVTFTVLGAALALIIGASGALQFASNPWVNLFIAFVLIAFGLSLLGAFELRLPHQLTNYLNPYFSQQKSIRFLILLGNNKLKPNKRESDAYSL